MNKATKHYMNINSSCARYITYFGDKDEAYLISGMDVDSGFNQYFSDSWGFHLRSPMQ